MGQACAKRGAFGSKASGIGFAEAVYAHMLERLETCGWGAAAALPLQARVGLRQPWWTFTDGYAGLRDAGGMSGKPQNPPPAIDLAWRLQGVCVQIASLPSGWTAP